MVKRLLFVKAYCWLIIFDFYLVRRNFEVLYRKVRQRPARGNRTTAPGVQEMRAAVDLACIWYPKPVLCLQRSAATVCLLKSYGVAAHLVIGAQQMPFRAHAWVEVAGEVVNDRPYMREMYAVLEVC